MSSRIEMYQGNNKNWLVTVKDELGAVRDISSAEITFSVKENIDDVSHIFQRQNTAAGGGDTEIAWVTDGTDGKFKVLLIPANTDSINGSYRYDVEIVISGRTLTILRSDINVKKVVT